MKKQLNALVQKLSERQPVSFGRPEKTFQALEKRIGMGYVHVMFTSTETELGLTLKTSACDLSGADFERGEGKALLCGYLTLNYEKVKCIAELDIASCEGIGYLVSVDAGEYEEVIPSKVKSEA